MPTDFARLERLLDIRANTANYMALIGQTRPTGTPVHVWGVDDDEAFSLGENSDIVVAHSSAGLAADEELTGIIVGTSDHQGVAANSILLSNITANGDIGVYVNNGGNSLEALLVDASLSSLMLGHALTSVRLLTTSVLGTGEGGTTAPTGQTLRAADIATGGAGNEPGADFTTGPGLGTGTGDVGRYIWELPIVAADGDFIQTRAERLALDMVASSTVLTMSAAQAMTISTAAGNIALSPNSGIVDIIANGSIYFGSTINNSISSAGNTSTTIKVNGVAALVLSGTAGNHTMTATSVGVARSIVHDITINAGGAANAVLAHGFQLDETREAGLLGETDGAGSYTQAKSVWKIPYLDAAAGAIGPTAPTTAATWNGGLFLGASDAVPNGRLYWYANEAAHYVDATAGFSYLYKEPTTFGNFNYDGPRPWERGDFLALKVDRYDVNGGHALPYPFSKALQEQLLDLLREDTEFREDVKQLVGV